MTSFSPSPAPLPDRSPDGGSVVALYTDGGCIGPNPSPYGGTWAWTQVNQAGQRVREASGIIRPFLRGADGQALPVTNNNSELIALTRGLLSLPEGWCGQVFSDSRLALGWCFWGYKHDLVPDGLYRKMCEARERLVSVQAFLLDGHPTQAQLATGIGKRGQRVSVHNKWADEACTARATEFKTAMNAQKVESNGSR